MMHGARILFLGGLLLGSSAIAMAQTAAGPPRDPKPCEPGGLPPQSSTRPPGTADPGATTGSGENLSDKLSRGDGVLCPPQGDREISVQPPGGGKTPVIPPPGSPGGDPTVRPK